MNRATDCMISQAGKTESQLPLLLSGNNGLFKQESPRTINTSRYNMRHVA